MAFEIFCKDEKEATEAMDAIASLVERSRFYISSQRVYYGRPGGMWIERKKRSFVVSIRGIRLKEAKGYCGQHSGACRLTGRSHPINHILEGLDWISWNNLLNDALDSIGHRGRAQSSHVIIRKDGRRRISYYSSNSAGDFNKDADYQDYLDCIGGETPITEYDEGTPGIFGWGIDCREVAFAE